MAAASEVADGRPLRLFCIFPRSAAAPVCATSLAMGGQRWLANSLLHIEHLIQSAVQVLNGKYYGGSYYDSLIRLSCNSLLLTYRAMSGSSPGAHCCLRLIIDRPVSNSYTSPTRSSFAKHSAWLSGLALPRGAHSLPARFWLSDQVRTQEEEGKRRIPARLAPLFELAVSGNGPTTNAFAVVYVK